MGRASSLVSLLFAVGVLWLHVRPCLTPYALSSVRPLSQDTHMHTHVHIILQVQLTNTKRHQDNQKTRSGFAVDTRAEKLDLTVGIHRVLHFKLACLYFCLSNCPCKTLAITATYLSCFDVFWDNKSSFGNTLCQSSHVTISCF